MKVTKSEIKMTFRCNQMEYPLTIPAGLRCRQIGEGSTAGKYWLDEFPKEIFPRNSILLHDATHYGIVLEPDQVADKI